MKKHLPFAAVLALPGVALAADTDPIFSEILGRVKDAVIIPFIELLFILALLVFIWGVIQFIMYMGSPTERQAGQKHMFWGIIGLAIMISAFGILRFVFYTVVPQGQTGVNNRVITPPKTVDQGKF